MSLHKDEKEWIKKHLDNGAVVAASDDKDFILDELNDFTVYELQNNEFPTKLCIEAEDIIERVARFWDMKDPDEKEN